MQNCIFSAHCTNAMCDKSCPTLAETTYLLDRNNIKMNSHVFNTNKAKLHRFWSIVSASEGKLKTIVSQDTVKDADLVTYCGICKYWKGSRLHCTVYHLKYSQYVEMIKKSWSTKAESSDLEYMRIWSSSCKLLIVSNLDYVNFKDFDCQTLLTLIQERASNGLSTIIVTPQISSLVGDSPFFGKLTEIIKRGVNA